VADRHHPEIVSLEIAGNFTSIGIDPDQVFEIRLATLTARARHQSWQHRRIRKPPLLSERSIAALNPETFRTGRYGRS